jgi:carboxyl-terminal processing protease
VSARLLDGHGNASYRPGVRRILVASFLLASCATSARVGESAVLDEVARTVREHFYDPGLGGVDWADALDRARTAHGTGHAAVEALLAELGASHTSHHTRDDVTYHVLLELFWEALEPAERARVGTERPPPLVGIGILTETIELDGREAHFVRGVLAGGPAETAGLRVGDRLLRVEGQPFTPVASFRERAGRATRLCVQRTRDPSSIVELEVVPEAIAPRAMFVRALRSGARVVERDGKRLGYAHLWSWAGEELQAALRELLLGGPLAEADGLVLDLRGGYGGANPEYLNLFRCDLPALTFRGRDGAEVAVPTSWTKPVVLLVDEGTTSGKEVFAQGFRRLGRGPIVGARTAGAVSGGRVFVLGDGSLLYLAVQDVRVDGERIEGRGVEPDLAVPWSRPGSEGADPQLEAALQSLAGLVR